MKLLDEVLLGWDRINFIADCRVFFFLLPDLLYDPCLLVSDSEESFKLSLLEQANSSSLASSLITKDYSVGIHELIFVLYCRMPSFLLLRLLLGALFAFY